MNDKDGGVKNTPPSVKVLHFVQDDNIAELLGYAKVFLIRGGAQSAGGVGNPQFAIAYRPLVRGSNPRSLSLTAPLSGGLISYATRTPPLPIRASSW